MRTRKTIAAASITFVLTALPATALDPNTRITQYRHTSWRVQEGAFESAPNAIAQTMDGYIWIGTNSGLVKYDGVHFTPWSPPASKGAGISAIYSLLASSDGTLWIGDSNHLLSWKNNILEARIPGRINAILEDRKGRIWVARSRVVNSSGGLCQVAGESPRCVGGDHPMDLPYAGTLSEDMHGNLWIGSSNQLMKWNDGSFESFFKKDLQAFQALNAVESTVARADGSVWAAIPRKGFGLFQVLQGLPRKLAFKGIDTEQVSSLFVDRDDSVWMGTHNNGLYRIHGALVDRFRAEDGLSSDDVSGFYQDREGDLWLTTSKGLDCFRDSRIVTFSRREGLGADLAASVLATDDGNVWIGNRDSLDLLSAGQVTSIRIPGHRVTSLWQDHAKRLWVGVDNELTIYTDGRFQRIKRRDGSPLGTAIAITEDGAQNIWVSVVGERREIVRIRNLRVEDEFTEDQLPLARLLANDPASGIWLGLRKGNLAHYGIGKLEAIPLRSELPISGLMVDADGSVWASTSNGIARWKNREVRELTSKNGLPCDNTFAAIRDNHATLWIYAKCGLISIADAELERWWKQPDSLIQLRLFDVFDGAMPGLTTFQPALSKSPDGRLWFVNDALLQTIDPDRVPINPVAPPIYVEGIRADRKDYAMSRLVHLPAHSRDVEIAYTALSYSVPQKVLFRYRLDGRDHDWQDAGTRRRAFYNDLGPGQYRFHVSACNSDGVWNQAGALIDFSIDPAYYQTRWFQAVCLAALLAMLWGLYRFRLHQMAQRFNLRLEERVTERTRIARELHDTLLQSFQGLILRLQVVEYLLPDGEARNQLEQTLQRADQAVAEGRTAVYDLRSSTTTTNDLAEAVQALGEELARPDSAGFRLEVIGAHRDLHPIIRDEIYRVAREALRNAFGHAEAHRIETELAYEERAVRLRIRDDGKGIPEDILEEGRRGHYGLCGMRERARQIGGKLEIWSRPGTGTEIELTITGTIAYRTPAGSSGFRLFRRRQAEL